MISHRSGRIVVFAWLFSSIAGPTVASEQLPKEQFVNPFSETWGKRIDNLSEAWDASLLAAMETRTGGVSDRQDKALLQLSARKWIAMANDFWTSDGVFKKETYDKTISRIPLVPGPAERLWHEALSQREGGDIQRMLALGPLLNQDALFAGGEWQEAAFSKLLARVTSLPSEAVSEWAKWRGLENRFIAAVSLARVDAVFPNEHFEPSLFSALPR
jgi:hypothetical protein